MCHKCTVSDDESAARKVERGGKKKKKGHPTSHMRTQMIFLIATTRRYLVTALALETEPSSSDNDGSGEVFAQKKKVSKCE